MQTQTITSANTSLNQLPCTHKLVAKENFTTLLDFGCGKYDTFKNYIQSLGKKYFGYDKYNRSFEENMEAVLFSDPDLITCNNVLNVIEDNAIVDSIVNDLAKFKCKTIICVYEGNKTGEGKVTKNDCYQRNQKAVEYLPVLKKYFNNVIRKGNIFICEN
jgi:hypothetical protein